MQVILHVRKYREEDLLQAVAADLLAKRHAPWDPANPDLRGFNLHAHSESELLDRLPRALNDFLEHLGLEVDSIQIERDLLADVANDWPAVYTAHVNVSRSRADDPGRISGNVPTHPA